ncbi:MAG TPA: TadE family protein [Candidatus Saccharimonadales bacterium]|nr:TadE family protein [Candidatus Saccharimonadales bacterium]
MAGLIEAMARYAKDDDAQSLVEFALTLPIFLLVVTGLFDVSRAVWQENTLAFAAREGTRYAIVHGSAGVPPVGPCSTHPCPRSGTEFTNRNLQLIVDAVVNNAIGVPNITVVIDYLTLNNNGRNQSVSIDATAPFVPLPSQYLLGDAFQITLRGGSQLVIQR